MEYKIKRFSFTSRLKAGLKGAWTGIGAGAILTPGNVILALCGKKKASLIMTGIGAGIGAGIGFYYGWRGQKNIEEYQEKLNTDPKFREKKKKELQDYIKSSLNKKYDYRSKKDLRNSGLPLRPDFYKYYDQYSRFREKYYDEWVKAWENLNASEEIDIEFDIVFPTPCPEEYYKDTDYTDGFVVANFDSPSDHYWIMWDSEKEEYNNDLGSGRGTGKTLLEASQNFASQWIVDEKKIQDPGILEVAKIHNRIIKEFLKLK